MAYRIELSRSAGKALLALPTSDRRRVERAIDALAQDPRPGDATKLQGGAGALRLRVGEYGVLYEVADDAPLVLVLAFGPRKNVYRRR